MEFPATDNALKVACMLGTAESAILGDAISSANDEHDPATSDLKGIVADAKLFFEVGLRLANEDTFPHWRDGSEFNRPGK